MVEQKNKMIIFGIIGQFTTNKLKYITYDVLQAESLVSNGGGGGDLPGN